MTSNLATAVIPISNASVLPVELLSFEAVQNACVVDLRWSTASEFNNNHFTVFRSLDALNWEQIGKVEGNGTTSLPNSYSFTDNQPIDGGISYYRLLQTDFDGMQEWLPIVSVDLNGCGTISARVFPNPTSDKLNVQLNSKRPFNGVIAVYDAKGALVYKELVNEGNLKVISVGHLAGGLYYLNLQTDDSVYNFRIVIAR
jgi:hypothetical protein